MLKAISNFFSKITKPKDDCTEWELKIFNSCGIITDENGKQRMEMCDIYERYNKTTEEYETKTVYKPMSRFTYLD